MIFFLIKTPSIVSSDDKEVEGAHGVKIFEGTTTKSLTMLSIAPSAQDRFPIRKYQDYVYVKWEHWSIK